MENDISILIGKDLSSFKIIEMTEVYRVDYGGIYSSSIGFFKDDTIAVAFAGQQTDENYIKTAKKPVLTDGEISFVMDNCKPATLFDEETESLKIKDRALRKLTQVEKKLLGL
ncbi:MAG: hypothetical protein KGI58_02775 [Patescibacteria group bacterium]|nr:hypothetical protein [Patescibacteria group bacterium]